jgi:hypothetical protein
MRTYKGISISKSDKIGYALPWSVYMNGQFFYADTLKGIKQIISENL